MNHEELSFKTIISTSFLTCSFCHKNGCISLNGVFCEVDDFYIIILVCEGKFKNRWVNNVKGEDFRHYRYFENKCFTYEQCALVSVPFDQWNLFCK